MSDWFDTNDSSPTRLVFHSASVQNSRDASGATAPASTVAAIAVPLATAAARNRPVMIR